MPLTINPHPSWGKKIPRHLYKKQKFYGNNYTFKLKAGFVCPINFNSCGVISNSKNKNNGKNYQLQKKSSREQGVLCT